MRFSLEGLVNCHTTLSSSPHLLKLAGQVLTTALVVYNARKRGEDRASDYFKRTENVAGVKDMRFQALMPDILHWLGITKIDRMLSMSKYVLCHVPRRSLRVSSNGSPSPLPSPLILDRSPGS